MSAGRGAGAALLAAGAGSLLPLSLSPFDLWPALLLAAMGLFLLLDRAGGARAFLIGWAFGAGKYAVGASWIYVSIHVHGAAAPPLATFLVALFVAGLALFQGAMAWGFVRLRAAAGTASSTSGWGACADAAAFSVLWVLHEWLLTWFLTGFPWLFAGYAFLDTPLESLAPVGGVLLVSLAGVFTAAALAVLRRAPAAAVLAAAPWLAAALLSGTQWTERGERRSVALVQGNVPQQIKWRPEFRQSILDRYETLTAQVDGRDLVVWPEAAIPVYLREARPFLDRVAGRSTLVAGIPITTVTDGAAVLHNGAVSTGGGAYLKRRLVPFGDYVPFEGALRGLIAFFDLPMSRARPGPEEQPPLAAGEVPLAMAICYEIAYPDAVRRDAAGAGALVTVSNDTWFGSSIGPHQHMQIARMRALENGRFLLRATNNGVTGIVDDRGAPVPARVLAADAAPAAAVELPQFRAAVLDGHFHPTSGRTPYSRVGHAWLAALTLLAAVAFAAARWRRRRHARA